MRIEQTNRRWCLRRFACAGLTALLAAWPLSALALGLGEPVVKSHLGARLLVQIPLFLDSGERADEVKVRLASAADRARFRSIPGDSDVQIRLAVVMSGRGGPSISVTSASSVREPALTFVIEVKSSATRFMREYTVLLDPVDYRATPKSASARSPQPDAAPSAATAPRPAVLSPGIDGDTYGPVVSGDTLSELGAKLRADSRVSVSQMSVALFQANPQAFSDKNVNRLVSGAYLRVPNRDEVTAMSSRAARELLYGSASPPPGAAGVSVSPSTKPSVTTSAEAAVDVSVTLQPNAGKPARQVPIEPPYRLSILAAEPRSDAKVENVISRLSGSKDIAVRDLITRLENARQAGEQHARENLDLRGRIAAADTRITTLAVVLRERNERIAAAQIAIEAKRVDTLNSVAATVTPSVDMPLLEGQSHSLLRTVWRWLAQITSQASLLAWLGALATLCGVWLLVRRSLR